MNTFPPNPKDGQVVEIDGVKYQFSARDRCWIKIDGIDLPGLATPLSDGLMSKEDYTKVIGLLLPPPKTTLTVPGCGVTFDKGRIALQSTDNSLEIKTSPTIVGMGSSDSLPWKLHENTYGVDFTLNVEQLLAKVIENGRLRYKKSKGPPGAQGEQGLPGVDRLDTGPQGLPGDPGANAPFSGTLALDDVALVQTDAQNARAVVDVTTEQVSADENFLVVTRALIGNPSACPKLVRPKKINSPWLLVLNAAPNCYPPDAKNCPCNVRLQYLDVTAIVQAIQDRYEQLVRELKAQKEAACEAWMKTMISVFNDQKNALCCALENCQSRKRNQDFRDKVDEARIQAAQRDLKLLVKGADEALPPIEMDPGKTCAKKYGKLDVVNFDCPSYAQGQSNSYCASPDGYLPVPLSDVAAMDLTHGAAPAWPDAPQPFSQILMNVERGLYRVKAIDVAPVSTVDKHSRRVQIIHSSGQGSVVVGQAVDYSAIIANLGGVNKALNPSRPEWPQFHAMMNADPQNHIPVIFHHSGGWIASFINYDHSVTKSGPNYYIVNGASTILIESLNGCPCAVDATLDPSRHYTPEFNEEVGVRLDGLPSGDYEMEITTCCYARAGLFSGAYRVTTKSTGVRTTAVSVTGDQGDGFTNQEDAKAAYLGLRQTFNHPGGSIWLWLQSAETGTGQLGIRLTRRDCAEEQLPGSEGEDSGGPVVDSCEMVASQVEWYERGWRIERCCGALVLLDGRKWIVVKRSIGIDLSCGGGESANTPCLRKFIDAQIGHPAVAWPTLDGIEFEGRPTSGSVPLFWDHSASEAMLTKIRNGDILKKIGNPEGIELVLFPQI